MKTPPCIVRRPLPETPDFPGMHPVLSRVYRARGIAQVADIEHELTHLPSFHHLQQAEETGHYLAEAILLGKKMVVIGDFDADGATSTAVALRVLRALGAQAHYLVPDRFVYGYGLTPGIVDLAHQTFSPHIIITVDNGISSLDGVDHARDLGIDVVITDHHLPGPLLPKAQFIVNPNQPGDLFPSKALAGVGVIFYVMLALRAALDQRGFFETHPKPRLANLLDIVAVGTVADVVPLDHVNRILVTQGLHRIRKGQCVHGIRALLKLGRRPIEQVISTDLGFIVGPRINAAGRLEDMSIGIECLLADDPTSALDHAQMLHDLNVQRREIELDMQQDALLHLPQQKNFPNPPSSICLYDPSWHQGVIGILASRIKDEYHRPVFIFARQDETRLKGSGRSIPGFHLKDALTEMHRRVPHLIEKFGGHAMAAGLTLPEAHLTEFEATLCAVATEWLSPEHLERQLLSDGALGSEDYTLDLAHLLERASPWGQGFPEPLFDDRFDILSHRIVGDHHLKLTLYHPASQKTLDGIYFQFRRKNWDPSWTSAHLAFRLQTNTYQKTKKLQLLIEHMEA